jgi:tetratricopeptide (TPR) repeat protein
LATALAATSVLGCTPTREERLEEIRALQAEGRYQETVDPVMALFEQAPDDPEMMRLYGRTMLAVEIPTLAIWPLRTLAEHPDGGVEEHLLLARALHMAGAARESFETMKEVVAADPDHERALIMHTELAVELGDDEATLASSENLIRSEPRVFAMAHLWKAKALAGLDRFEEADQALESGLEAIAPRPDIATWRPRFCQRSVEIAEAEDDETKIAERWEACLEQFPKNAEITSRAIEFFDEKGDRDRATVVLETAIAATPKNLDYRSRLAKRLAGERRYDEAEATLLELTQTDENPRLASRAWLGLGELRRNHGHFEEAIEATERGIAGLDSVSVLLMAQHADDHVQAGRFDRAEELIDVIDKPEYASLLRGRIALAKGDPQKAREFLLEGLKGYSGNATAHYLAGKAAAQLGDLDQALENYRDAIRSGPTVSDAPFELARLYEAQGNLPGASYTLGIRLVKAPDDVRVHEALARLSSRYMKKEAAIGAIERLDALPGQDAAVVIALARLEALYGGPASGASTIETQLAEREMDPTLPENVEVLHEWIEYLGADDRSAEAVSHAREALAEHPEFAPFYEALAIALTWDARSAEEIEDAWTHALEFDPKSARALAGQARLAADANEIDQALALFDASASADPDETTAAWSAIEVALAAEREDAVDERLEKLLLRDPIHGPTLNLLARRLMAAGADLDRVEALAKRAVRFAGNVESLETMGLVSMKRGEHGRALRSFMLAIQRQPQSPSLRYQLARALIATGQNEKAAVALRRALESKDFPEADEARAELAKLDTESTRE